MGAAEPPLWVWLLLALISIAAATAAVAVRNWYERRIVSSAKAALTSVEKFTSACLVGDFDRRRCRLDFCVPRNSSFRRADNSFLCVTVASGGTIPFTALRSSSDLLGIASITYQSGRPDGLTRLLHSGEIRGLLESLLIKAQSVVVSEVVSARLMPFRKEYVEPVTLTQILFDVSALADALDRDAVQSGASLDDVERRRCRTEARFAETPSPLAFPHRE
jgi:hypothetical protein